MGRSIIAPTRLKDVKWFRPTGGASDDVALAALFASCAYKKKIVCLPGDYRFADHLQSFVSGITVEFLPGSTLVCAHEGTTNAGIFTITATEGTHVHVATSDVVVGSKSVIVDALTGLTVGGYCRLQRAADAFESASYKITAIDVENKTLTVDRPILRLFAVGANVYPLTTSIRDVHIIGHGLRVSGSASSASRAVEMIDAWNCSVEGLVVDAANITDLVLALDNSCWDCYVRNCEVWNNVGTAVALEMCEHCGVDNVRTYGGAYGIVAYDSRNCSIENSCAFSTTGDSSDGIYLGSEGGLGCFDCSLVNCDAAGNSKGIETGTGSRNILRGNRTSKNSNSGLVLNSTNNLISGHASKGDTTAVTNIGSGSVIDGLQCNGCIMDLANAANATLTLNNYVSVDGPASTALVQHAAGTGLLRGAHWQLDWGDATAGTAIVLAANAGLADVQIVRAKGSGTGISVASPAVVHLSNIRGTLAHILDVATGGTVYASGVFDESNCSAASEPTGTFTTTHAYVIAPVA